MQQIIFFEQWDVLFILFIHLVYISGLVWLRCLRRQLCCWLTSPGQTIWSWLLAEVWLWIPTVVNYFKLLSRSHQLWTLHCRAISWYETHLGGAHNIHYHRLQSCYVCAYPQSLCAIICIIFAHRKYGTVCQYSIQNQTQFSRTFWS